MVGGCADSVCGFETVSAAGRSVKIGSLLGGRGSFGIVDQDWYLWGIVKLKRCFMRVVGWLLWHGRRGQVFLFDYSEKPLITPLCARISETIPCH